MSVSIMDETRPTTRETDLSGRSLLVVGAGKSGLAASRLAVAHGATVILCDREPVERLPEAAHEAARLGIELRAGSQPAEWVEGRDLVVVSPGVPPDIAPLCRARELGIPVWGEVELAVRFCRGRIVAITGSNGKSTVTTMVGSILRGSALPGGTGGNLDRPLSDLLEHDSPEAWHALELSSFQLESVESLHADVALLLNLSPDHLDRHASLEAYADAKARLLELQAADAYTVLNADDDASRRFERSVRGRLHRFSTRSEPTPGAFLREGRLTLLTEHGEDDLLAADELRLPGEHNVSNALAAALAGRLAGCAPEAIRRALVEYRPLPHRLELVAEIAGVRYYNDSKATNPASASRALAAFPSRSVHIILGGRDKQASWDELVALVGSHARQVLLVGEAGPRIARLLSGSSIPVRASDTVSDAVRAAHAAAGEGEIVLLAPGCASFDQYRNFEERGEDFRRAVHALTDRRPGEADG